MMLGLDNPVHLIFLLVLVLLVFGAKRLPEMGRSLGSGMRGFKDSLSGESGQAAALEQAPPVVVEEPSAVAITTSEPGQPRAS
jgi:sec-independent protein translocase protein TatA